MYVVNLKQEAGLRRFVIEKKLTSEETLAMLTDNQVLELILGLYIPVIIERPSTQPESKYQRDFYLISKEDFIEYTTKIEA